MNFGYYCFVKIICRRPQANSFAEYAPEPNLEKEERRCVVCAKRGAFAGSHQVYGF
jgi:hypothetical protein